LSNNSIKLPAPFILRIALSEVAPPYSVEIKETIPLGVIPMSPTKIIGIFKT
jgi:hypothetical protein